MTMIFITAMTLGMTAVMLRSVMSVVLICLLLVGTFVAAVFLSAGPLSFLPLMVAVFGYNAGIVSVILGFLVFDRARTA
jgi:hypothetical protein